MGSTGNYEATIERFTRDFINRADLAVIEDVYAPDAIHHSPMGNLNVAMRMAIRSGYGAAMPDFNVTIQSIVAENEWVAVLYAFSGTFTGRLTLPDGSMVNGNGAAIQMVDTTFYRFNASGQVAESWETFDNLGLLIQMDIMRAPSPAN